MFSKKTPKGILSHFYLEFNVSAIARFIEDKQEILPAKRADWDRLSKTKKYQITFLGTDPFIFYHNTVNQFSPYFGGSDTLDAGILVEWQWTGNHTFAVSVNEEIILLISDQEIVYLLLNGNINSSNAREDMDGYVEEGAPESGHTDVYKTHHSRTSTYSNELVSLSVTVMTMRNRDVVHYDMQ